MTWRKRTIMEMAREAGIVPYVFSSVNEECLFRLKAFADLVRADEAEKYKWDVHSCGPTCGRYACVATREAVLAEREACAKLLESRKTGANELMDSVRDLEARAIRARSNT